MSKILNETIILVTRSEKFVNEAFDRITSFTNFSEIVKRIIVSFIYTPRSRMSVHSH